MALFWRRNKNDLNEELRVIKPAQNIEDATIVDDSVGDRLNQASVQEVVNFLESLKSRSKTKEQLYETYDKMEQDSIVSGALEVLTDDICRKDPIRDKRVWAEAVLTNSKSKEVTQRVNEFLTEFKMDKKCWAYSYNLLKYGEMFLKTYDQEIEDGNIDERFADRKGTIYEKVSHPDDVLALEKFGTLVGFGKVQRDKDDNKTIGYQLVKTSEYIHFCMDRKMLRQDVSLSYKDSETSEEKKDTFQVIIGSSYLESSRTAWAIMDLIETLLLYLRYGKSDLVRLVKVEVGSAGRAESVRILRNTKRLFKNQDALDLKSKTYQGYSKPIPHGSAIFIATRQGKGDLTVDDIGGNWDVKNIVDLDYWLNKLLAALKVPKAYLGLEDGNLTGLNNQSLTRQDIRYCHTVEAFQEAVIDGIKDMCDHYLESVGLVDYVDDYQICMAKIMSAESTDRMEDLDARIQLASNLRDFMSQVENADMNSVTRVIIDKILDLADLDPTLSKALAEARTDKESEE